MTCDPSAMTVLAFDTAMSGCSAAVRGPGGCASETVPMERGQSEALMPMIKRVMEKAGARFDELDAVGVTRGPGAFTGLRIGIAAARALGLALDIPVVGLTTLEVLARQCVEGGALSGSGKRLWVLVETRREDFYCQRFDPAGVPETEPQALDALSLAALLAADDVLAGDAVARFTGTQAGASWAAADCVLPDPALMAAMAAERAGSSGASSEPLYLRGADVSQSKRKPREIEY